MSVTGAGSVDNDRLFASRTRLAAGWYAVLASRELSAGQLAPVRIASHRLVVFRDAEGQVHALNDACPHLGAPLSSGRVIERDGQLRLQCPLHHWQILPDGCVANTGSHTCESRTVRAWPCHERYGLVWVALTASGNRPMIPPQFEGTAVLEHGWWVLKQKWLDCHPHWLLVNGLDMQHFSPVHGMVHKVRPILHRDGLDRPALELSGYPGNRLLRWLIGARTEPLSGVFTGWGAGSCGLEFFRPIHLRVVFTARPAGAGGAFTRLSLSLPSGLARLQALLLIYYIIWRDSKLLEGTDLKPDFCVDSDAGLSAFASLIDSAGEVDA